MPLSEHVYCLAIVFKMTEWVKQWICIKLCIKLERSSVETLWMFQRLQLWATSDWQLHHNNLPPHASCLVQSFWQNIKSSRWLSHPRAQNQCPAIPPFPKTSITFEREEISDCRWDSGKYNGAADGDWENCVSSKVPTLKGTEASLFYVQCLLYLLQ